MKWSLLRRCFTRHTIASIVYVACGLTVWHVTRSIPIVLTPAAAVGLNDCPISLVQGVTPPNLTTSVHARLRYAVVIVGDKESDAVRDVNNKTRTPVQISFINDVRHNADVTDVRSGQEVSQSAQPVDVIPRTVHITWFFPPGTDFRFHHAICLLSVQRFFRPTKIFFWHDAVPTGRWWAFVRQSVAHLLLVPYARPTSVFNRNVTVPEHQSDVARLELIEEYGGLYVDLDVILVRSLDPLLRL